MTASAKKLWVIVPIKPLAAAKARLETALSPSERAAFVCAMAQDVFAALAESGRCAGVLVVTADDAAAASAARAGASILREPLAVGLSEAFARGFSAAREAGADLCAFIPGDAPLLTPESFAALADQAAATIGADGAAIGLLACKTGEGTNALFASAHHALPNLAYGVNSLAAHQHQPGRAVFGMHDEGLSFDVDTPADFAALEARLNGSSACAAHTRAFLAARASEKGDHAALLGTPLSALTQAARAVRDYGFGAKITYSKKVFLPLTHLCRDACGYCVFAQTPRQSPKLYMSVDEALAIAEEGARVGCKEALFTLGERPELRYRAAREWLDAHGFESTPAYVAHVAGLVRDKTGLLPHINAGVLSADELAMLRRVSASMGAMVENLSPRLSVRGGPHEGAPDKTPEVLLEMLESAGRTSTPFTTGLLVGIGESRAERLESLAAIKAVHRRHGHIQEIIIQNFAPKPGTRMADAPAAPHEELVWTIAVARLMFGPTMSVQAPPNLSAGRLAELVDAGVNDWGGVSPITPDFVNPEAPWPSLERLAEETKAAGKTLTERLTIYPRYAMDEARWLDPAMQSFVLRLSDAQAYARPDQWVSGRSAAAPAAYIPRAPRVGPGDPRIALALSEVARGGELDEMQIETLFSADGEDFQRVCAAANAMRARMNGARATFIVNRNINYTNLCTYHCAFCGFSKGDRKHAGGEKPYLLSMEEITDRTREAEARGAGEVCLQGGIHPSFTGETYIAILRAVRAASAQIHIHAFSPLEVTHGAQTLGLSIRDYLQVLKGEGLGSLPGTAAEILHDPVRAVICPDKLSAQAWLDVIETAHEVGLKTTATIMFGHVETYRDWAIHLVRLRELQKRTGGFTEFVPLAFVAHEAPLFRKGAARAGPTFREAVLMHAVARLTLAPHFANIQASWVKMGAEGLAACLHAGANDLGGVLMNESITRAAGATHGQEMSPQALHQLAADAGRIAQKRTTLYQAV